MERQGRKKMIRELNEEIVIKTYLAGAFFQAWLKEQHRGAA
jgi:hypothetical protein